MGRRWIVAGIIVLACVGIGTGAALLTRDDATDEATAPATTTSSTTRATGAPPSSSAPTTTAPPASTAPPTPTGLPDPCGAETGSIRAAIDSGVDGARERATVDTCRRAAVDPSWAVVTLTAQPGAEFANLTVLVQGGGGSWAIVDQGTRNVGCGQAPQQVLADLGTVCSSTGGNTDG
jgi:hypothetical protein